MSLPISADLIFTLRILPFVFAFGASVGSFLNVVIYRLPVGLSLIHPPSRCPHCFHSLGTTENVPVLGWLWLRGKCRWCHAEIPMRYPLVELVTGILFCFILMQFGWTGQTLNYWVLISFLLALALIDWDTMTLPSVLTKSGLVVGLILQLLLGSQRGELAQAFMQGLGGALVGLWLLDLIRIIGTFWLGQEAMGDGDPKLAAMMGAWLGWKLLLVSVFLACSLGAIIGGLAIAVGGLKQRQGFPFGPFLAGGALLSLFWGDRLLALYSQIFLPNF